MLPSHAEEAPIPDDKSHSPRPELQHEAEYARRTNTQTLRSLRESRDDDPGAFHTVWALESQDEPVQGLPRASFTLPAGTARFVGEDLARELQELLHEAWALNERFVGWPRVEAQIAINGSPEQRELIERGLDWARAYVARRLARRNPRDRGCPYRRFDRLYNELIPFIDQLGLVEREPGEPVLVAVTGQYLVQMCDYAAWSFYQATWAEDVVWDGHRVVDVHPRPEVDPVLLVKCQHVFQVYAWRMSRVFDVLLRRMASALAEGPEVAKDAEAAQEAAREAEPTEHGRIVRLAEDIHEMRPFLVRNFRRSRALVELPGGLLAHFSWAQNDRLGMLRCAESERELLEQEQRSEVKLPLAIDSRGLLSCSINPWRNVASHEDADDPLPVPALAVGRAALEAVHARLFAFYDQVDVEAILARWRSADPGAPASAEEETLAIAAGIAADAEVEEPVREGRVRSSLRLSRLQSVLERSFNCSARSGKGSELLFYREGGHLAYVARHKQNPQVSATEIQRILRKLGIGVREWLKASGR